MGKLENENLNRDGFAMLKRWMENRNAGKTFVDYFQEYGYKTLGIYDAGELGRLLYEEIKDSDLTVCYFADRNAEGLGTIEGIPVIYPSQIPQMEKVDVLVISPIVDYEAVCQALVEEAPELQTLSLKEAVYEF